MKKFGVADRLDKNENRVKIRVMNVKVVRDALASLDGKSFDSREDAENAVYVPFAKAKLHAMFTGEGHRDLFDRLERALWVKRSPGTNKWTFTLPSEDKFTNTDLNNTQ